MQTWASRRFERDIAFSVPAPRNQYTQAIRRCPGPASEKPVALTRGLRYLERRKQ